MAPKLDWKKLKHARGPAALVPQQIKKLTSEDGETRDDAYAALAQTLWAPGEWFSASAPATSLLLDVVDGDHAHRFRALWLIADVLTGGHRAAMEAGLGPKDVESENGKETRATLVERKKSLFTALVADEAPVRSGAALVLAFLPEIADETRAIVRERLAKQVKGDDDDTATASFFLCLGLLGEQTRSVDDVPLIADVAKNACGKLPRARGAAALARLLADPKAAARPLAMEIAAGLAAESAPFAWCGGPFAQVVVAVARARGDDGVRGIIDAMTAIIQDDVTPAQRDRTATVLIELGDFKARWGEKEVALPSELSDRQRKIAEALAARDGIGQVAWGLPMSARDRRRWLGLSPGGPLEKIVSVEIDGKPRKWPLWKVWRSLYERKTTTDAIPVEVASALTARELLVAMAEVSLCGYGIRDTNDGTEFEFEQIVDAVEKAGPAAKDWATAFANELAGVLAIDRSPEGGGNEGASPELSTLVLLPIVRGGMAIEPKWDGIVTWYGPYVREMLATLPPKRREQRIFGLLSSWWSDPNSEIGLDTVIPLLDLVPSRRIAAILLAKLKSPESDIDPDDRKAYLAKIRAIAKREPAIREALDATKP